MSNAAVDGTPNHPRYRPRNPSEVQCLTSSIQVLRTSDNRSFLATKIPDIVCKDVKGTTFTTYLADAIIPTAAQPLSHLLNHPNIISLIDIVRTGHLEGDVSERGEYGDIVVFEDMTAGCLSYVLPLASTYPRMDDELSWHTLAAQNFQRFSLPEGLCWHVLRSILRALLWLHYGIRETLRVVPGEWTSNDEDWQTVLIGDVSPGQVWFKDPKGSETYGECKLGGFSRARVCAGLSAQMAVAPRDNTTPMSKQYFWAPEVYRNIYPPSPSSEIWSLGATVYCMMTGIPPPRYCDYDWQISRMNDKGFSQGLRELVALMLKSNPDERPRAAELINQADEGFAYWRATTVEGAYYVDIADEWIEQRERDLREDC